MSEKSKKLDNRIIAAFIIFAVYVESLFPALRRRLGLGKQNRH